MKVHISLNVRNVADSIKFYEKMFGISPSKIKSDYAKFDLVKPSLNLTINQTTFDKGGSLSHLGLQVETTEEVLEIRKKWTINGLITLDEMQTDCCYALQNKTWINDPDGNQWEVFVVLADTKGQKDLRETSCCASNVIEA